MFPPKPKLTEKELSNQTGKVFIVTGSSSGLGELLSTILYQHHAKVYIAARSQDKASAAIERIKKQHPDSKGELVYLHLDLDDLSTIKRSAHEFLSKETRLDVLWNNAGVMVPPKGSKTAQGYELQLGTNCLGPFLFTQLLVPILAKTAKNSPPNSVRVIWVSSSGALVAPNPAVDFTNMDYERDEMNWTKYSRSKAGNVIHSSEFARRNSGTGILSLSLNPGNLITDLQRHTPKWQLFFIGLILHPPIFGAYTEIYAGLSSDITEKNNGGWVAPWSRIVPIRKDLADPGIGKKYWEWSEEQVKAFT